MLLISSRQRRLVKYKFSCNFSKSSAAVGEYPGVKRRLFTEQQRHQWSTGFRKEPFKKHILHQFSAEQQQKEQFLELQQQERKICSPPQTDPGRASVEVI